MRIALVAPVDPTLTGNGAALRASFWRRTLAGLGELTTIIIPIISEIPDAASDEFGEIVGIEPFELSHDRYPAMARLAPEWLGARWSSELPAFDLIVGFRSYIAPFCLGLAAMYDTPVVVDLDDADADFHEALGDPGEARRYRALVADLAARCPVLLSATGFPGTVWLPNVAALATIAQREHTNHHSANIVMVANLGYWPNAEGAQWFIDQVWPTIYAKRPDASLTIAGLGSEQLEFGVGFVEDLNELYGSAHVAIAPILHGSGTRIKILDAWARHVPVVATAVAIDGLRAIDGEHALIEDRPRHFADAVLRLLDDPNLGAALTACARDHLGRIFDEHMITGRTRVLLHRVVVPPSGPLRVPDVSSTETNDGVVVDDPTTGQVHHLDAMSAMVYSLCDGLLPLLEISDIVADILAISAEQSIRRCSIALNGLVDAGLIDDDPSFEYRTPLVGSRRFRLRPGTFDDEIVRAVYADGDYEVPARLAPGTMGIDIGAHIGSFTARMIDAGADLVVAAEPQQENFTMATINLAGDIERGRVELRRAALWSPPAGQPIVIGPAPTASDGSVNTGGHESRAGERDGSLLAAGEVVVASETLDDIVDRLRRDVSIDGPIWLKLDCEGAEWPILETTERLEEIEVIVGELHLAIDGSTDRLHAVVARLESSGFDVVIRGDPEHRSLLVLRADRRNHTG